MQCRLYVFDNHANLVVALRHDLLGVIINVLESIILFWGFIFFNTFFFKFQLHPKDCISSCLRFHYFVWYVDFIILCVCRLLTFKFIQYCLPFVFACLFTLVFFLAVIVVAKQTSLPHSSIISSRSTH